MRVLLTGYTGFLGRHLARALTGAGFLVRIMLHRKTLPVREIDQEATEVVWGSLDDPGVVQRALHDVDCVVHSAWAFSPPDAARPTVNENMSRALFEACVARSISRFAFMSSVAVYGMHAAGGSVVSEETPIASGHDISFIYPSEKIAVETLLRAQWTGHTAIGVFRPGPIFDATRGPMKSIVKVGCRSIAVGFGDGQNRMGCIHADDAASAVLKWIKTRHGSAFYNVTPSRCLRHRDWYRSWGRVNGLRVTPVFMPTSAVYLLSLGVMGLKKAMGRGGRKDVRYALACATRDICYSNDKIKKELGWQDDVTSRYTSA